MVQADQRVQAVCRCAGKRLFQQCQFCRAEFTTDLPDELAWIPEFKDVEAVAEWLLGLDR